MKYFLGDLIEHIFEDFCDNYCKKPEEYKKEHSFSDWNDEASDDFTNTVCSKCPFLSKYCRAED